MIPTPKPSDIQHKSRLLDTLTAFYDSPLIAKHLYFKGGTCAAMQGFLERFSVDLDFDYAGSDVQIPELRMEMERIFKNLDLTIAEQSKVVPQYFLKYKTGPDSLRNTLKIDVALPIPPSYKFEPVLLPEINRVVTCQTRETMFANKLIALIDRHKRRGVIAGRDVFDVHSFFLKGFAYDSQVILDRYHPQTIRDFFIELEQFVIDRVAQADIDQDLNALLPYPIFKRIRLGLKQAVVVLLRDEIKRLKGKTQ